MVADAGQVSRGHSKERATGLRYESQRQSSSRVNKRRCESSVQMIYVINHLPCTGSAIASCGRSEKCGCVVNGAVGRRDVFGSSGGSFVASKQR